MHHIFAPNFCVINTGYLSYTKKRKTVVREALYVQMQFYHSKTLKDLDLTDNCSFFMELLEHQSFLHS